MYEERNEKFTLKDIILQILFIALFVFLLVWLFPTKGYVNQKVDPLLDTIFNMNVMSMKDAAKSYYTISRLPQEVGDKEKMTLREMLEKKIILSFTDKYGKECDLDESYVEVTKEDEEFYIMKVNLKCSQQEDYILVHMGCYDYCQTTICETEGEEIVDKDNNPVTPVVPDDDDEEETTPKPVKKYQCEYVLKTNGYYTNWSTWSNWTTNKITVESGSENIHQVETKSETKSKEKQVLIGYNVVKYYDGDKPIKKTYQVVAKKKIETVCDKWGYVKTTTTSEVKEYVGETYLGTFVSSVPVTSTSTDRYELVSIADVPCDSNCSVSQQYTYKWYAKTYEITYAEDVEKGEYGCLHSYERVTPIYGTVDVIVGYEISERKDPVYKTEVVNTTVTYYRDRTRKYVNDSSKTQWSTCNNSNLINNGWVFTGNKREVE